MRLKGTIVNWNDERGFGFIIPEGGGERIFLHVSALMRRKIKPQESGIVTYEIGFDHQQRPCAVKVQYENSPLKFSALNLAALTSIGFIATLFGLTITGIVPWWLFILYIGASLLTLLEYAFDKHKARHGKWRTSEAILHTLELLGGWPGALIAQQIFRHKNRKVSFQISFWIIVAIHICFWIWFLAQRPDWLSRPPSWLGLFEPIFHSARVHL
jgi:uncharacterized membrane protein YsdA (DUF1294 family)/cold shock CspA family protein